MPTAANGNYMAVGRSPKLQHKDVGTFAGKVAMRGALLPKIEGRPVRILDAFAGEHDLWDGVRAIIPGLSLEILHIEQNATRAKRTDLRMHNVRAIGSLDLPRFDLIDLDSWGVPGSQTRAVAESQFRGVVVWTCILTGIAGIPNELVKTNGVPPDWKFPRTLFGRTQLRPQWCSFLADCGWTKALIMEPVPYHMYGAVGYDTFDRDLYQQLYVEALKFAVDRFGQH